MIRALVLALLALLPAACGGVSHHTARDAEAPRRVAVLPFGGDAPIGVRELCRGLLSARLAGMGYAVQEAERVDRVLAEAGWLQDPADFAPDAVPMAEAVRRLDVDGVLVVRELSEGGCNFLLFRRHSLGGGFTLGTRPEAPFWRADHTVASTGGFVLRSGQVLSEFRAQTGHYTPMESMELADRLIEEIAATLPRVEPLPQPPAPAIAMARAQRQDGPRPELVTLRVEAQAPRDASLCFDLPGRTGIPMVAVDDGFVGLVDLPREQAVAGLRLRARDPFGGETVREVNLP